MNQLQPRRGEDDAALRDAELSAWRSDGAIWARDVERIHDEIEQLLVFVESSFERHVQDIEATAPGSGPTDVRSALRELGWNHRPAGRADEPSNAAPSRSHVREQHRRLRTLHAALRRSAVRFTASLEVAR